jgi:uncharacterized integral membrane protein
MADPQHVPDLDPFDRTTVTLYRAGLVGAALSLGVTAVLLGLGLDPMPAWIGVLTCTSLSVLDLHLYDKRIRWFIVMATHVGACLMVTAGWVEGSAGHWLHHAGVGFLFVTLSALALKEQFCFRVPFLRVVPVVLALSLVPLVAGVAWASAAGVGVGAVLLGLLAGAKLRMPLHYDIGDKSHYQI